MSRFKKIGVDDLIAKKGARDLQGKLKTPIWTFLPYSFDQSAPPNAETLEALLHSAPLARYSEAELRVIKTAEKLGLSEDNLLAELDQILAKWHQKFPSRFRFKRKIPPIDLAEEFLYKNRGRLLVSYCSDFYEFNGFCYQLIPLDRLEERVIRHVQNHALAREGSSKSLTNNIIENLRGFTALDVKRPPPLLLEQPNRDLKVILFKNGILDVRKYLDHQEEYLSPHSDDLFATSRLPFNFDPSAQCPRWKAFLNCVLDPEKQRLLSQWMGYNIVGYPNFQKFLILIGEGANGKTVICVVMRALLGLENVSAIPIEAFDPKRPFQLPSIKGKLANICEEMNAVDKVAEGYFKQIISGGLITLEEKYKPPYEFEPGCKFTFATNVMPKFGDRSDGLWRRMLVIPFLAQIPEKDQNRSLTEVDFWINSGELPGILNWCLDGYRDLIATGQFSEPASVKEYKDEVILDSNPARNFLIENYEPADPDNRVGSTTLYHEYRDALKELGHHPLSARNFAAELKRIFPKVNQSKNAVWINTIRQRAWAGLRVKARE